VELTAKTKDNVIEISVTDSGVGMSVDALNNLFKIETSFSTRGTENEKGTGLGLLLCKEFVEKHGGRIWAESPDSYRGDGSTFYFTIPFGDKS
jgi:signal transduction histidine kinase